MSSKAQSRIQRQVKKSLKRVEKTLVALKRQDFPRLTGISAGRLSTMKRRGNIAHIASIPATLPRRRKAKTKTIAIVGFRELITIVVIEFLIRNGFSEQEIFEGNGTPRSRGLLTRCEAAMANRHGNLNQYVLVVERDNGEIFVKITRRWPLSATTTLNVHVLDFRVKIPALVAAIMALKHQPCPEPTAEYSIAGSAS